MNRNVESHFAELPSVDIERSIFDRSHTVKTSFPVGRLIPFACSEVLPGDTFRVTTSKVVRLQTLLTPVMDNLYLDTYWFFVPNRLVWSHWKEFCGENTESAWVSQTEYQIPTISAPEGGFAVGTIADYLGLPVGVEWSAQAKRAPMALPFRCYAKICEDWFRDENLTDPLNIPLGDANQTGTNGDNYIDDVANGGMPFKVAKYHDYFTSMLPSPLKAAEPVTMGAAPSFRNPLAPVVAGDIHPVSGNTYVWSSSALDTTKHALYVQHLNALDANQSVLEAAPGSSSTAANQNQVISNYYADLQNTGLTGVSFTINELRLAFQLQKFYERNARGGTRYIELIKSHFGVTSPDSRLQRSEYLGGNRVPVQVHEVTNTAQSEQDFLGDLGAMSVTSDIHEDFEQSFTEHGFVLGVMALRYDHSYPQGMDRFWTRRKFTDFYLPVFSSLGEMPAYKNEIYADASTMDSDDVFGYHEAWAEYRFSRDYCTGEMRPGVANTLAHWHFGDYYTEAPTLSDGWIREDPTNVDRTLAVTSQVAMPAFADIYVKNIATRPMPMYSIPGLIDHH